MLCVLLCCDVCALCYGMRQKNPSHCRLMKRNGTEWVVPFPFNNISLSVLDPFLIRSRYVCIFRPFWIRLNLFLCCTICFSAWQFMILIKERACMLLTGRMVFSDYTIKRILFYHAKGSHARSHHTHARSHHAQAQLHTSLRVLFCSCAFRLSRSTALQVMASTLDRAQLLDYTRDVMASILDRAQLLDNTRAGVRRYSKSTTDTCVVHA